MPEIADQTFYLDENSETGTIVGVIEAHDLDEEGGLMFDIVEGNKDNAFILEQKSGELTVEDSAWFNYEINQKLVCKVSVSDNDSEHPLKSYTLITIEVKDVPYMTVDISGYVQKGPFILGSPITISELQADLQPTGRVFTTQIMDNSGKYELPDIELESQYLLLKADGFYFNERTGGLSQAQLTLFNLVDITQQESFNINVISHLEKERIMHLMGIGVEFSEAKQQAKNEILDIFGFASVDQLQSEQMNIASEGEDNAMLLASSLILQGDRSTGEFSELLSQISLDYREDGTMESESLGTKLINGIYYANLQENE